jgi:hypothetical protein
MRIFVGQIYIEPGVTFPFSFGFNKWLGDALSQRIEVSEQFRNKFGAEFGLGIRVSAKQEIDQPEIRGPTVFKRDKDVEFSIFLPHRSKDYHESTEASFVVEQLLEAAARAMQQVGLNTAKLIGDVPLLRAEFLNTPGLLNARKP